MDQKFLIVANWKANEPPKYDFLPPENLEVAIAAPYPLISSIPVGFIKAAQDVSQFGTGAETGEVPAKILAELGVKYCLVGHSERRKLLGETTQTVGKKAEQCLKNKIVPIVCARNLTDIPTNYGLRAMSHGLIIMYEPEQAISTNGNYHPESPEKINQVLSDWQTRFPDARFLYGGSVNPKNTNLLITNKLITGLVVGHASLDPQTFSVIIKACAA